MSAAGRRGLTRAVRTVGRGIVMTAAAAGTLVAGSLVVARTAALLRERVPREVLAPAGGRLLPAGDGRLFVQEAGPVAGRVVVLLHGTGAWSGIWAPVTARLAAAGFRTVAVDLPPFGFSDRLATADYGPASQASRLWAALDAIRADSVILVGHSFGARATVAAALMHPKRVARLVLIDAALGLSDAANAGGGSPSWLVRAGMGVAPVRDAVVAATVTNPLMTRTLVGLLVADPARLTDDQIAMLKRPLRQPGTTRAAGAWLPGFVLDPGPDVAQARRALAAFAAPAHVIWGELDSLTPLRDGRELSRMLRCATLDVLPGTGHIPGLESPEQLALTLQRRLEAPPACRPGWPPDSAQVSAASAADTRDE